MTRIVGIDIPDKKPIWIALTHIYGVGRHNVQKILIDAKIDTVKKTSELTSEEVSRISKALENYKVEGDLRKEVGENIKRLKEIGSYRGSRHSKNLPSKGQRTRSNARTKRGKRVTIGAMKKEVLNTAAQTAQKEGVKTK
ncbi:30S ribosomal protein S13 [Candidatus Shapirobacteria bacterium CG08_land_8_20_14_0_20_39_18]|uniref:Small ribosomal subunit protein uS13 n=1 Tax=Candidatus Shapirobacteria bacterium CG08_land_8_20_14_0_20_39_18 TaxID=1974883 RepID=A0A2M6XEB3_9BACT|nr:MAG: 30S ribosomal protein S13 [Candidatus Shapirobacteria bacterium CG08_land_8_20_14_0_20_39_18]PIY66426.1 MAG: 30S ribosomal protein S13 [Candidatus Shapirobacteria bacterium CG_4_10_14_0_8_um_filter_39_15]PJE68398.1 MAG: 30S ribosomal protein S13 [Candidatus Shapirobacteria bacterium CG10_big_fil_rev_8_21_14_0_10_38_8]